MIRIEYDDHPEDIIEKVNAELKKHGLELKDDDKIHDGFVMFELVKSEESA